VTSMPKKKIRDAEYLRRRLARDFPAIYADLVAKKYTSVNAAAAAAGLIRLPTRLDALKRAWKKSSVKEQVEFLKWVRSRLPRRTALPPATAPASAPASSAMADPRVRLKAEVRRFLADWLSRTKSRPARIMKEMGLSRHDVTLNNAILRNEPVRKHIAGRLVSWLAKNGYR
jgi:hypothetical protein